VSTANIAAGAKLTASNARNTQAIAMHWGNCQRNKIRSGIRSSMLSLPFAAAHPIDWASRSYRGG